MSKGVSSNAVCVSVVQTDKLLGLAKQQVGNSGSPVKFKWFLKGGKHISSFHEFSVGTDVLKSGSEVTPSSDCTAHIAEKPCSQNKEHGAFQSWCPPSLSTV